MVLGLMRVARGKRTLFLLDEPDTHLNPVWQHSYLDLIRDWTGVAADASNCQIVLTSHNPLTIAALTKEEVRVMFTDAAGKVTVSAPYADPRGMGFTATLTEIFGLPTSLDPETQRSVDERNALARIERRPHNKRSSLSRSTTSSTGLVSCSRTASRCTRISSARGKMFGMPTVRRLALSRSKRGMRRWPS